jgi:hypothetical protein
MKWFGRLTGIVADAANDGAEDVDEARAVIETLAAGCCDEHEKRRLQTLASRLIVAATRLRLKNSALFNAPWHNWF